MPGVEASEKEKLFNDLVLEWNKKINLVSRKRTDVYELIEDSKTFFDYIDFSGNPKVLDFGTGGGFPGIVLKIHHPEMRLTLLDSIGKKIKAVTDIVNRLELEDVEIICSRAEDLARLPDYKNSYDYIVARAVATFDLLTEWSKGLVKPSGKLLTIKGGPELEAEIRRVNNQKFVKKLSIFEKNHNKILVTYFDLRGAKSKRKRRPGSDGRRSNL
jgi:16S rRNA (guanine527-N7)-methyltransferase